MSQEKLRISWRATFFIASISLLAIQISVSDLIRISHLKEVRRVFAEWEFLRKIPSYSLDSDQQAIGKYSYDSIEGLGIAAIGFSGSNSISANFGNSSRTLANRLLHSTQITAGFRVDLDSQAIFPIIRDILDHKPPVNNVVYLEHTELGYIISRGMMSRTTVAHAVDSLEECFRRSGLSKRVVASRTRISRYDSISPIMRIGKPFVIRYPLVDIGDNPNDTTQIGKLFRLSVGVKPLVDSFDVARPRIYNSAFKVALLNFGSECDSTKTDYYRCKAMSEHQTYIASQLRTITNSMLTTPPAIMIGEDERISSEAIKVDLKIASIPMDRSLLLVLFCFGTLNSIHG